MASEYLFPNEIVYKGENFKIAQDWEVPIPGFFIISSLRKIRSVADFTEDESYEFIKLMIKLRKGMKEILTIHDVYFFQNEDSKHGFHFWVFPRYKWMEEFGRKIESVKPIMHFAVKNMQKKENLEKVFSTVKLISNYLNK